MLEVVAWYDSLDEDWYICFFLLLMWRGMDVC